MLVEIPDPEVILQVVAAFVAGALALLIYYKVKSFMESRGAGAESGYGQRLSQYEQHLLDMKIRMDALGLGAITNPVTLQSQPPAKDGAGSQSSAESVPKTPPSAQKPAQHAHNHMHHNATDQVLHTITTDEKTSRQIQSALGRSREHTARLLKKLYDDGLVDRNRASRPYTYSLTAKGRERIGLA